MKNFEDIVEAMAVELSAAEGEDNPPRPKVSILTRCRRIKCSGAEFVHLSRAEQMSMKSVIAWAAVNNNMAEIQIMDRLVARFDLATIEDVSKQDYDEVIRFLVDDVDQVN